jgi:hypothetical protein
MPKRVTITVEMDDLFEICKAAQGAIELDKLYEKEEAAKFILNRAFAYLNPEYRAEFSEWVDRKGWLGSRPRETIILN